MSDLSELSEILSNIDKPEEINKFFDEILTDKEKKDIVLRWELMKMLEKGVPQRTIASELGISLCKITRGSKIIKSEGSVIGRILKKILK
jgi:TrpR family trp operon transcriptional repressor